MAYAERRELYRQIESERESKVVVYVTGDRKEWETWMSSDALDYFVPHLDALGVVEKISLILYTQGGETLSAWSIANLFRMFCDRLEIIVPSKCHSAGTLLCLGADNIVMTKQATLGAIDPSVSTRLNPRFREGNSEARVPVSVEDVNAFIKQARESLPNQPLEAAFDRLAQTVHPLVLGTAFRARAQIRMLGERLLLNHMTDQVQIEKILDFLCSESGSHDYTINRREARRELGLPIETPSWDLYEKVKAVHQDFVEDLELRSAFNQRDLIGSEPTASYLVRRALIESVEAGSHQFTSEGILTKQQKEVSPGSFTTELRDQRVHDYWRFYDG